MVLDEFIYFLKREIGERDNTVPVELELSKTWMDDETRNYGRTKREGFDEKIPFFLSRRPRPR